MDMVGNARHGVNLPYNYWSPAQWEQAAQALKLRTDKKVTDLKLYPWPADWLFGRSLHFVAQMTPPETVETLKSPGDAEGVIPVSAIQNAA